MFTMLLGGLWHGASWTFVAWGMLHGLYLWAEKAIRALLGGRLTVSGPAVRILMGLLTFILITVTWVFFRSQDFGTAGSLLRSMAGLTPDGIAVLPTIDMLKTLVIVLPLISIHWFLRDAMIEEVVARIPWWLGGIAWATMIITIIITQGGGGAFIYFQF
jgi:alginate O-acetyltransferase complex protein AlgI